MSLIKKADVKNHLSARHRSGIHLAPPAGQPDVAERAHEDSTSEHPMVSDSVQNPPNIPAAGDAETTPPVASKSVEG